MNQKSPVCPHCGGVQPPTPIEGFVADKCGNNILCIGAAHLEKSSQSGVDISITPAILDKDRQQWLVSNFRLFKKADPMPVRFMYVRDICNVPIATLAMESADSPIGVALCHPKDQFNKKIGRIKAAARIHMKRACKPFPKRIVQIRDEEGYGCFLSLEDACVEASVRLRQSFLPAPQEV